MHFIYFSFFVLHFRFTESLAIANVGIEAVGRLYLLTASQSKMFCEVSNHVFRCFAMRSTYMMFLAHEHPCCKCMDSAEQMTLFYNAQLDPLGNAMVKILNLQKGNN